MAFFSMDSMSADFPWQAIAWTPTPTPIAWWNGPDPAAGRSTAALTIYIYIYMRQMLSDGPFSMVHPWFLYIYPWFIYIYIYPWFIHVDSWFIHVHPPKNHRLAFFCAWCSSHPKIAPGWCARIPFPCRGATGAATSRGFWNALGAEGCGGCGMMWCWGEDLWPSAI